MLLSEQKEIMLELWTITIPLLAKIGQEWAKQDLSSILHD